MVVGTPDQTSEGLEVKPPDWREVDWREVKGRESTKAKILSALLSLREALPLTTGAFREAFANMTGCEFVFDENASAKTVIEIVHDVWLMKYGETINVAYCGDKSYIVKLRNVIEVRRETFMEKGAIQEFWIANFDVKNIVKEE
jgi:hypothetical protein